MTDGVPYAFVPGTKAKADEVNANFNDIIQKIQTTNNALTAQSAQTSGSITTINNTLATKANSADIDGTWVSSTYEIFSAKTWAVGANSQNYLLTSYLPDDNNVYEVIVTGDGSTAATSGSYITFCVGSSYVDATHNVLYKAVTRANSALIGGGCCVIPVSQNRKLVVKVGVGQANALATTLKVLAYRKVR